VGANLESSFEEMHFSGKCGRGARCSTNFVPQTVQPTCFRPGMIVIYGALPRSHRRLFKTKTKVFTIYPAGPLLEADRDELEAQMDWAQSALREAGGGHGRGTGSKFPSVRLRPYAPRCMPPCVNIMRGADRPSRKVGAWARCRLADARLPLGFHHLEFGPEPLPENPAYADRERYHAVNFLQEVQRPIRAPRCYSNHRICRGITFSI